LAYAHAGSGGPSVATALLLNGSGAPIKNYERGYDAITGLALPGFPQQMQGLDFLGAPVIADIDGSGRNSVIDGADSSALMAFTNTGLATGWPKFQSGWTVFSPSIGDLLTNGFNDVVSSTREGYLMAWRTPGPAAHNQEWWGYHHDEWRTGRYGADTRPPGTLRNVHWSPGQLVATFTAPGDDWYVGTVTAYHVTFGPSGRKLTLLPQGTAGTTEKLVVPVGTQTVTVQAVDDAGNLGPAVELGAAALAASSAGPTAIGGPGTRASRLPTTGLAGAIPAVAALALAGAFALRLRRRHGL
jgi:hypothetical protein